MAVVNPPRHFGSPPHQVISTSSGYCAYLATGAGVISIRLRSEFAPNAVNDFVFLARSGFYDGLTFFKVCPDPSDSTCPSQAPIAVAGDPTGSGAGGPGYTIAAEPVVGEYLFGSVAMYGPDPSKVGSQFFISKGDSRGLARNYVIFGQVTDGIPALASLQKGATIQWVAVEATAPREALRGASRQGQHGRPTVGASSSGNVWQWTHYREHGPLTADVGKGGDVNPGRAG